MHVALSIAARGEVGLSNDFLGATIANTDKKNRGRFQDRPLFSAPSDPRVFRSKVYWDGRFAYNRSSGRFLAKF